MNQITRRRLLLSSSLVALAGYAGSGASCNVSAVTPILAAAFQAVGREAIAVAPQLMAYGLSDNAAGQVARYARLLADLAGSVSTTTPMVSGADTLTKIEAYVNAVAPIVAPFVTLVPGGSIIGLIIATLPEIEAALNFTVSLISQVAQQVAATAPPLPAAARLAVPGGASTTPRIDQLVRAASR